MIYNFTLRKTPFHNINYLFYLINDFFSLCFWIFTTCIVFKIFSLLLELHKKMGFKQIIIRNLKFLFYLKKINYILNKIYFYAFHNWIYTHAHLLWSTYGLFIFPFKKLVCHNFFFFFLGLFSQITTLF